MKEYKKLISVSNIVEFELVPSQLGQTTTTLSVGYNVLISGSGVNDPNAKVEKKLLKLIFANPFSANNTTTTNNSNMNISPTMTMSKAQ